jgi:hypothetical protein
MEVNDSMSLKKRVETHESTPKTAEELEFISVRTTDNGT